jgi:PAS domain S-box-containing protein
MTPPVSASRDLDTAFLAGGGELGELMRAHDWAATPLGPPAGWPRSLKTVVRIMLTSRQPIWIGWGPQLTYLYNDPYQSIIGGKHPWALGLPIATIWREIWSDIEPLLDSAMNGDGIFVENQLLIMERNGYPEETYYTFSYSPIPGDDGRPAGIICANADETQRVVGERQLALLRDLAAMPAEARTVDLALQHCARALQTDRRDLPFTLVLLRGHGEAGFTLAASAGLPPPLAAEVAALDFDAAPWRAAAVLEAQQPALVDLPAGTAWPSGDWREPPRQAMLLPIRASGDAGRDGVLVVGLSPYRLPQGRYVEFLQLVAQQLSAAIGHAEAYELQQRKAEELARLDRAKTQFFSNISHEFRTPLTLMMGPLHDLLTGAALPPAVHERLAMVERNALRLSKLVNALLEFSRIEAGRVTSVFRPTDLAALTAELASSFRSAMERAGLAFVVDCPALPAPVYVDRDHWERIVLNLLSNALKYTLQGGVAVRVMAEPGCAVVVVEDTGIGVAEDEVPRLFERFHRIEGAQARTHEGSGIGLALVQELMRLHRGDIAVDSRLGAGTRFTLRLPFGHAHLPPEQVRPDDDAAPHASLAPAFVQEVMRWLPESPGAEALAPAGPAADTAGIGERYRATLGARIVVADDNADMRQYLRGLLTPHYRVEEAADGVEALAAVRRERPALLLSDVMMPRLDGFGLLAALRADAATRTLPVVLLSARAGQEAQIEGLSSGADDYLVKPFTARELLARVSALIALDRLRQSGEQQLRLYLSNARVFSWDLDLRSGRLALSDNAVDVLGAAPADLQSGFDLVHDPDVDGLRRRLEEAVRTRGGFTHELRVRRPDNGELRWVEMRAQTLCNEAGEAVGLSGISFDMTDRKRMEQALRESDRRKDEFLAMLAHELRNPLAPIRNSAELMLRTTRDTDPARRAAEIIDRQVQQMARMVDDLLDVSRITHGRIELAREPVDLGAVIASAVEAGAPAMQERGHRLQLQLPAGPALVVQGDAARLQQCVVNLLSNAAKYTDPGGDVALSLAREGDEAVIRVRDSGAGIPADVLPVVFDLFVQSARTLDRAQGGLGIGLSVVRRLVEMHDGRVAASSAGIGCGSTFEIRLPLTSAAATAAAARPDGGDNRRRILVIDDNIDAAESLAMMLAADGHEVHTGFGADDALQMVPALRPDVVLLDIGLPVMDGYQVARRLRAGAGVPGLRLIALTGYGQPEDRRRSAEAGFDDHLVKPVGIDALARALGSGGPNA